MLKIKRILFRVFVCSAIFVPTVSMATGVTVSPALIEEEVVPGQVFTQTLKITNNDDVSHTYYVVKKDIKDVTDSGVPIFNKPGEASDFALSSWMTTDLTSFLAPAHGTKSFVLTIKVPANASPGAHLGAVSASIDAPRLQQNGAGTTFDVNTIISLNVSGQVVDRALLYQFHSDKFLYGKPEVDFFATVASIGNTIVRPVGTIHILDMFSKDVDSVDINSLAAGVVPGGNRQFTAHWSGNGFSFGKYTAVASFSYGTSQDGKKSLVDQTSFWILPLNIVGPVVGAMLLISLIVYLAARFYVQRQLRGVTRRQERTSKLAITAIMATLFLGAFLVVLFMLFA